MAASVSFMRSVIDQTPPNASPIMSAASLTMASAACVCGKGAGMGSMTDSVGKSDSLEVTP